MRLCGIEQNEGTKPVIRVKYTREQLDKMTYLDFAMLFVMFASCQCGSWVISADFLFGTLLLCSGTRKQIKCRG